MREMGPWEKSEGHDEWREEPRRAGEAVPYCSFCGSLHPGKFLKLVGEGWSVGPTDKNYKAYLHPHVPSPTALRRSRRSSTTSTSREPSSSSSSTSTTVRSCRSPKIGRAHV